MRGDLKNINPHKKIKKQEYNNKKRKTESSFFYLNFRTLLNLKT